MLVCHQSFFVWYSFLCVLTCSEVNSKFNHPENGKRLLSPDIAHTGTQWPYTHTHTHPCAHALIHTLTHTHTHPRTHTCIRMSTHAHNILVWPVCLQVAMLPFRGSHQLQIGSPSLLLPCLSSAWSHPAVTNAPEEYQQPKVFFLWMCVKVPAPPGEG